MRISRWLQAITLFLITWISLSAAAYASVQSDPVGLLKYIADNMINELRTNQATLKNKPEIVYQLAYKYVVPYADLPEMSKRVLPPRVWNSASASQRMQFQKEFTRLVIRTYASGLTSYKDQQVHFFPVRQGGNNVEVKSEITSPSTSPILVVYRLVKSDGKWKVYDMSVEGVSLISSFRSQFSDILANSNMDSLLSRLAQHNNG